MNVEVPEPVRLDMPPGNLVSLEEVVRDVAGAAFHLTVLSGALAGPAASAPGWLGDDAVAATAQIGVAATLARRAADAVLAAMRRLSAHAECLHEARRRVAALEREQQDDFAATWVGLSQVEHQVLAVQTGSPAWVGPIDDLRASEESRRRRHAAVLEEVADDAAATARVLADSCAALGGRGSAGDAERVLAYFAAHLPGWGDGEMTDRGRALAEKFVLQWPDPQEQDECAREALGLAGSAAFAEAFLVGLGEDGLRELLRTLGDGDFGAASPLPAMLVKVLGAAGSHGSGGAVVRALFVDPADPEVQPDQIVLGLAVVLAAAATGGAGRLPPATIASWGRQIVLRESLQGASATDRVNAMMTTNPEVDAVPLVVELLSRSDDTGEAAGLLAEPDVWRVLLARSWDDCGTGLARLVSLAGSDGGSDGGTALRAGLEALGTGLDDGNPDGWPVERATANAVARPLAEGLMTHWGVPAGILAAGADGDSTPRDGSRLRGLGYLTIDPAGAAAVGDGVTTWVGRQPSGVPATTTGLAVVAVPAAWLAVQEYGQRLAHALRAYELEAAAEERELKWNATVGLLCELVGGRRNLVVAAVEPVAAKLADADGSWDMPTDDGPVFRREDAAATARAHALLRSPAEFAALASQARAAFDGAARALGELELPVPPDTSWGNTFAESASGVGLAGAEDAFKQAGRALRKSAY